MNKQLAIMLCYTLNKNVSLCMYRPIINNSPLISTVHQVQHKRALYLLATGHFLKIAPARNLV